MSILVCDALLPIALYCFRRLLSCEHVFLQAFGIRVIIEELVVLYQAGRDHVDFQQRLVSNTDFYINFSVFLIKQIFVHLTM